LAALASLVFLTGCRSARQELLEIELRERERQVEELKAKAGVLESECRALEAELEAVQRQLAKEQTVRDKPASAAALVFVKRVTLGRLTGGFRKDPKATYDDALQVLVEPRDADDSVVKAPGSVRIEVFEISPQGLKTRLSQWELTPRELRGTWDAPLIGGPAYRVTLPWKAVPTTDKIRVVVRFTSLDGVVFEAERDVTVTPSQPRRPGVSSPNGGPHLPEQPAPILPPGIPTSPPIEAPSGAPLPSDSVLLPAAAGSGKRSSNRRLATPSTTGIAPLPASTPPIPSLPTAPSAPPALPPPPAVFVPLDPPLTFQMQPFTEPVVQAGFQTPPGPVQIQLGPPRIRK
jgi:hypothetical protein